jgi:hypothetical protein
VYDEEYENYEKAKELYIKAIELGNKDIEYYGYLKRLDSKINAITLTKMYQNPLIDDCAICMCPLKSNNVLVLCCGHSFHAKCILNKIEKCPYCKYQITMN